MILLRAIAFNIFFFGLTTVMGIAGLFLRLFARPHIFGFAQVWARLVIGGARRICGIRVVVTGLHHVPDGAALLASQHQSAFDTLIWMTLLSAPSYVVKHELTRIPLFGKLLVPAGMIPVDRGAGAAALRTLLRATRAARKAGRQIIIFPEGTRVQQGMRVLLQPGIAAIAAHLDLPVIPVATDSGRCWGRRAFLKYPGDIHIAVGSLYRPGCQGRNSSPPSSAAGAAWNSRISRLWISRWKFFAARTPEPAMRDDPKGLKARTI